MIRKVPRLLSILVAICLTSPANAGVTDNLGLHVQLIDLEANYQIVTISVPWGAIAHRYSSRRLYENGPGIGWCDSVLVGMDTPSLGYELQLDTRVVLASNAVTFESCGSAQKGGVAQTYALSKEDAAAKGERSLKDFAGALSEPVTLVSDDGENKAFLSKDGLYRGTPGTASYQAFGWDGYMTKLSGLDVKADANGPLRVTDGKDSVTFGYDGNRRLVSETSSKGYGSGYTYDGKMLESIKNAWQKTYGFVFSAGMNLDRVEYPDGSQLVMFYDEDKDTVVGFIGRDDCLSTYSHISGQDLNNYKVQARITCGDKPPVEHVSTFHFLANGNVDNATDQTIDEKGIVVTTVHD